MASMRAFWVAAAVVMLCGGARVYSVTAISLPNEAMVGSPSNVVILGATLGPAAAGLRLPGQFGGGGFRVVNASTGGMRLVIAVGGATPAAMCGREGAAAGPGNGRITAAGCYDASVPATPRFGQAASQLVRELLAPGPGTPRNG